MRARTLSCPPGLRTVPRPGRGLARPDHEQDEVRVRVYNADVDGYDDNEERHLVWLGFTIQPASAN